MMKLSGKRLFSLLLAFFMVITMLPPNIVFAEDDIPVEEPSTPVCTGLEDCAAEIHEDGCPKKPAAEPAEDEEPIKPLCTGLEDCAAEIHEDGCPKKPADEPVKDDEPTKPVCTGLADCPAETHGEACEKKLADEKAAADKAAADAVAALIEALPTLEAVQAMPQEELPAAYEQVMKAHDAYKALTGDQKALLSIEETFFDGYLTYFASLTQPAADHSHTICGKTSCSCGSSHGSAVWQSLPSGTTKLTGGNYYLDGDVTLSSILTVSGDVSLCLNGHTLTTTAGKIYISSGCLTICDCTGGGRITGASTSWSVIDLVDSGSLTVYSGTIAATDSSGTAISAITTGDIQIRGGTVSAGRSALSISKVNDLTITSGSITSTSGYGISISQSFHDMKISGGTIKGFENGIHFGAFTCSGKVSISGGTIEATGTNVNAGGYASRLYGIGFSTGNAGTCYVYITGGTVKGAKGGIYNFKPDLTMNISGGTLGTSGTIGIAADRGTVNINGGKVYSVDCGGPATITVTNGEVYCVYLTAGAGSTGAGKLIVTGGTVGRVGSSTSYYGIGNPLYNPTSTISVEISGGTIVGSSYALYSVSQFSAKISGGTFSGATADIYMGEAPASFSTAYISMDGYSGDPLTFSLGTTVKPVAYLARQVANSSLITLVDSTYSLNYDPATKSVILTDIHAHFFNSTTHKCSCGAIGGTCGIGLTWILEDGVLTISGTGAMANYSSSTKAPWDAYKDDITSISVESGVTTVGDYAFKGLSSVTSATLADSVISIGASAFNQCSALTGIALPNNLTSIGGAAFFDSGLTSISIPEGVTIIAASTFQLCSALTEVTLPDTVTSIGNSAFWGCTGLETIVLPGSLTMIDDIAFMGCRSLETVYLPRALASIDDDAFNTCNALTDVYYAGTEAKWESVTVSTTGNTPLLNATMHYEYLCTSGHNYVDGICTRCDKTLPTSGTCGTNAYWSYNESTKVLTISGSGKMANYTSTPDATSITAPWAKLDVSSVIIENGITGIGDYAFKGMQIQSLTMADSVTTVGQFACAECTQLTDVRFSKGLQGIGYYAFKGCSLTSIDLPNGLTRIGGCAFYANDFTTLTIPGTVTQIDYEAFANCTKLKTLIFEKGASVIVQSRAFSGCTGLETVYLQNTVAQVGSNCFKSCSKISDVYFYGTETQWKALNIDSTGNDPLLNARITYLTPCDGTYHVFSEWRVTKAATCTSTGERVRSCTLNCGHVETETIPVASHSWKDATCSAPKTCTVCSATEGSADSSKHDWNSDHACTVCGIIGGYCGDPSVNSGKNVRWSLVDGKLTISGTGAMANYSYSTKAPWDAYKDDITSIAVENGVTTVGDYAFYNLGEVTSATLADSVNSIGSSAFYLCSSMASIKMSAGLTSIGSSAFWRSGLTSIDIPAGVTSIGAGALQIFPLTSINVASGNTAYSSQDGVLFNKNKTTLIAYPLGKAGEYFMPDSVTRIEESAFAFASGLSMVKLSSGLTSVNSSAFSNCTGLFTVVVPEGITAFFDFAFNGCPSLTVYYGGTEAQWKNIRFNSYNNSIQSPRKIYYRAMGTTGDVSYLFYNGTLTVYGNGDMADYEAQGAPWFSYYTEITKIVVEDGVTSIGDYAFDRCERASSITLSKDLTSIGEGAFQDCTSVTALTIPAGVTSIGDKAFRHCTAMKTLTFTDNAPTMGDAFYNIPNLTVYYPAGDSSWDSVAGKNYGNQYPVTWLATCGKTHDFENGVISYIWTSNYSSCTAALTCGNSGCMVSGSGNSKTVKSTSSREEATCSKPGKTVYTAVFSAPYETQTKEVPIPATGEHNYSKEVASAAFRVSAATCQSPAVYKKSCACGAASATETFTYGEAGEHTRDENHKCTVCGHIGGFCGISSQNNGKDLCWTLKDGVLTISGTGAMADYASVSEPWYIYRNVITSAVVGEGVTTLGQAAFDECEKLQTVELPSTLTVIGKWAFSGCSDLTAIDIPDSVHTIGAAAFGHCDMLTSVTIPAGVTEILGSTFYTCERLETVTLLGNITTIGDSAFGYCYKLKNFTIPSTVTSIGKYAFRSCWGLTDVTIPDGVTVLNYAAFSDCKNLSSIRLPEGLTEIGERVFYDCDALTSVTLPSTLTTLGVRAFHDCDGLTSIVIPDDVTAIGEATFSGCDKLTSVTLSKSLMTIGDSAFYFCPITEIEIPASVTSIAAKAFAYCRSLTEITFLGNAPTFGADAFKEVANATALYPRTGTGWAEAVKSTYGGTVTWKMYCPNGQHSFEEIVDEAHLVSEATCAQGAVYKKLCPCGEVSATETFIYGEAGDHSRDKNHKCTVCGQIGGFCGIGSQNNGKNVSWTLKDGVLTVSGTGAMANYNTVTYKAPWDAYASEIVSVVVENGITSIGDSAFFRCGSLESVSIADTVTGIGSSAFSYCKELTDLKLPACLLKIENDAFSNCEKLESVEIPAGVTSIGSVAFLNCEALTSVVIPGSVSSIGQAAFSSCTALEDAYYAGTKANWDEISIGSDNNRLLDTRIHYNCTNPAQHWTTHNTEATCTDAGYSVEVCACPTPYNRNKVETDGALGHDMGQWLPNPDKEGEERSDCSRCDHYETRPSGPVILLEDAELQNQTTVWIDGASYPVVTDPDRKIVRVPENSNIKEGSALVTYEYHTGTAGDVHTQYPTGMKVWILSQQEDGNFTATRVSEFDNLLQYSGCSIRIVGVKGIRMITSINQSTKKALTGKGLSGYTLVEYGTALCRASALADGQPMTLENSNVKSNYAYKKGVADPVFKYSGNLVQYTNVLVGFTDDDCKDDIAMRPYIILQNESGDTVTIYGGIIYRSIGYIAYQNRNAFAVGSDAYEYVWSIIHHVYGDEFDADYKS